LEALEGGTAYSKVTVFEIIGRKRLMTVLIGELFWMQNSALQALNADIRNNLDRYREGDFKDLAMQPGWQQKLLLTYDNSAFASLSGSSKGELEDSLTIYSALRDLEPRHATCMNVWVRLVHTDLLEYARARWFKETFTDEELVNSVKTHIFRGGVAGYRDDNAAGRPWWAGYIGSLLAQSNDVNDIRVVLAPLMRTTDTRLNSIERSGLFSEVGLAKAISSYLASGKSPAATSEDAFRNFVININMRSNGRYFGDMTEPELYKFLEECCN
jgi:hypothetical protein